MTPTFAADVSGTGFTVLDRVYWGNEKAEFLGGSCGNVLLSLAMLDHHVVPVLALGCDDVGDFITDAFRRAGADISFIARDPTIASPVLAQLFDSDMRQHVFSFNCPETRQELPRYVGIRDDDVRKAHRVLDSCGFFYTDRLSLAVVEAMEAASDGGSTVYFEPSAIDDSDLFRRALRCTNILKFSIDRLNYFDPHDVNESAISIVTYGAKGLAVREGSRHVWCGAVPAPVVKDTCGSGDMVSIGLIDRLLLVGRHRLCTDWAFDEVISGVVAGQRLAAANCAFVGARGLFERYGASAAREVLSGGRFAPLDQFELFN